MEKAPRYWTKNQILEKAEFFSAIVSDLRSLEKKWDNILLNDEWNGGKDPKPYGLKLEIKIQNSFMLNLLNGGKPIVLWN